MIRFACPGCGATYSVSDEKAGKTGKCPKCTSQFVIPLAEAPPPLPTPSVDANAPVEIAPCPGCQARLSVATTDLGVDVECPQCRTIYPAVRPGQQPLPKAEKHDAVVESNTPRSKRPRDDDDDERPRSKRLRDDDDDERPSRRRSRVMYDDDDERPSRRQSQDDGYDEDEDRPRRKKRKRRNGDVESKRVVAGILAIFLGIVGGHKFFLGYTTAGVIYILLFLCTGFVPMLLGLVDGIIYLTKSDEEFIETYQLNQKEWF